MRMRGAALIAIGWMLGFATLANAGGNGQISLQWPKESVRLEEAGQGRTLVRMAGAVSLAEPGAPDLPWVVVQVPASPAARVVSWDWKPGPSEKLADAAVPAPAAQDRPSDEGGRLEVEPDPGIYAGRAAYPAEAVRFMGLQSRRGEPVALFHICPFSWNPASGELSWSSSGRLEVTFALDGDPSRFLPPAARGLEKTGEGLAGEGSDGQGLLPARRVLYDIRGGLNQFTRPSLDSPPVEFLLITDTTLVSAFQPFVDWKNQMGSPAAMRTVQWINRNYPQGVDLAEKIRLFLKDARNLWGIQTVVMGGDPALVPIRHARNYFWCPPVCDIASDYYYACLDGTWNANGNAYFGETDHYDSQLDLILGDRPDILPDIRVGRISARSPEQVTVYLNKYMKYVKNPDLASGYLDSMAVLGEVLFDAGWQRGNCDSCGTCAPPGDHPCPYLDGALECRTVINLVHTSAAGRGFGFDQLYERYEHWNARYHTDSRLLNLANTVDLLNHGENVVFQSGHGDRDRWAIGPDRLLVSNVLALDCGGRYSGLTYVINCNSAAVDADCLGAAWQFSPHGGGLIYVGSTNLDFPDAAQKIEQAFFRRWLFDSPKTPGQAFYEEADSVASQIANSEGVKRFLLYSMIFLGDPDMTVWKKTPGELTVAPLPDIYLGGDNDLGSTVPVQVSLKSGGPAAGARVCLYKAGDALSAGFTGTDGSINLPFRPTGTGTYTITVTHPWAVPYVDATHEVKKRAAQSFVTLNDYTINDGGGVAGTVGNANGRFEIGETISLHLNLSNQGNAATSNLQLRLRLGRLTSSLPLNVGLLDTLVNVSLPIGVGLNREISSAFRVLVSEGGAVSNPPRQLEIPLRLVIQDGIGGTNSHVQDLTPVVNRPDLMIIGTRMRDSHGTASDGLPNDGETIAMVTELYNRGAGTASHLRGRIRVVTPGSVILQDSLISFPPVPESGSAVSDTCRFQVVHGSQLKLRMVVEDSVTARTLLTRTMLISARPPMPMELQAFGTPSNIQLTWHLPAPADTSVVGYRLYKGPDSTRAMSPAGSGFIEQDSTYTDEGLPSLARIYYRVMAVSRSGMESATSWAVQGNTSPGMLAGWPNYVLESRDACPAFEHMKRGMGGIMTMVYSADLLYAFKADGSEYYDGDGVPSTRGPLENASQGKLFYCKPAIADLDHDGTKEVIAASLQVGEDVSSAARILVIGADGREKWHYPLPNHQAAVSSPAVGDIDGDGRPEIVFLFNKWVMAFNSDGTPFQNLAGGKLFAIPGWDVTTPTQQIFNQYSSVALADVDNDGRAEIIFTTSARDDSRLTRLYVINGLEGTNQIGTNVPGFPFRFNRVVTGNEKSTGSPAVGPVTTWQASGIPGPAVESKPSIVVHTRSQLWVFDPSTADSSKVLVWHRPIYPRASNEIEESPWTSSPALGDINQDGNLDIVVGGNSGALYAFDGSGNALPGFNSTVDATNGSYKQAGSTAARMGSPILADISGDLMPDVIIGDSDGNVYAYKGTNGQQIPGFPYAIQGAKIGTGLVAWDIDNDHKQNLVIQADKVQKLIVLDFPNCAFDSLACPWPQFRHDSRNTGYKPNFVVTPVERVNLLAQPAGPLAVELRWTTLNQYAGFILQRRLGDEGDWEAAGDYNAQDLQETPGSYRLTDQVAQPGTWEYQLLARDLTGHTRLIGETTVAVSGVTATAFRLYPPQPNPFQPSTWIRLDLPRVGPCRVTVLDAAGREVRRIHQGNAGPGPVQFLWEGTDDAGRLVRSGVYFVQVDAAGQGKAKTKVIRVR